MMPCFLFCQDGSSNNWISGSPTTAEISGTTISFQDSTLEIAPTGKDIRMEGSIAVMSNSVGSLSFYSNGCYISNRYNEVMMNGDSIGSDYLESSFCNTGGNPLTHVVIALPAPANSNLYYLFYTDIQSPYEDRPGVFSLAPENLYYSLIDMSEGEGNGAVILKNELVVSDTPSGITFKTVFNQVYLVADGKIYIRGTSTHTCLHVIHKPNCLEEKCNMEQYASF